MALATVEDVERRRGLEIEDYPTVGWLLGVASDQAEVYCGRRFALSTDTVVLRPGSLLPSPPVVSVDSVTTAGGLQPATSYGWSSEGEVMADPALGPLTVVYTHGFAAIPPAVVGAVVDEVLARLDNGPGARVRSESIDGYSVVYAVPTSARPEAFFIALDAYRLVATSVAVSR